MTSDLMSDDDFKKNSISILSSVMPVLIENLIHQGKMDLERLADSSYVLNTLRQNLDILENIGHILSVEDEFIEIAQEAIAKGKRLSAIVLISTAIEHIINHFYRDILVKELDDDVITEIIKNGVHAKLGWIMLLVSPSPLSEDIVHRIKNLMDIRNGIVHYKAIPAQSLDDTLKGSHNTLLKQVESLDVSALLTLPETLRDALQEIIEEKYPERKDAKLTTIKVIDEFYR